MRTTLIFALILHCSMQCLLFAQSKNQLSIQTGLFHRFLDGGPLMNIGQYRTASNIFLESYGLQYQRKLNKTQLLAVNLSAYSNWCYWINDAESELIRSNRSYLALSGTFSNSKVLSKKIDMLYGGGIDFRVISYVVDSFMLTSPFVNIYSYDGQQFQLGAHGQVGLSYTPNKWLSLYTQFIATAYLFSNNFGTNWYTQAFDDFTYKKDFKFPSRFDLSLRFGVGINF